MNTNTTPAWRELKEMIREALDTGSSASKAFEPITEGLGLKSPMKPEISAPSTGLSPARAHTTSAANTSTADNKTMASDTPVARPAPVPEKPKLSLSRVEDKTPPPPASDSYKTVVRSWSHSQEPQARPAPETKAKPVAKTTSVGPPKVTNLFETIAPASTKTPVAQPPPVPRAGMMRKLFSFVIDQTFVWTVWISAVVVTMRVLGPVTMDSWSVADVGNLRNPVFQRFAVLEFATIWLAYLSIGIGVLDMTFGMWVWGIRLRYLDEDTGLRFLKKSFRVLMSFFFYAPILPSFILILRRNGRNLLDWLSRSDAYRMA
jgi:hypothetical protein